MKTQTFQRVIAGGSVWAVSQIFFPPAVPAMQAHQDDSKARAPAPTLIATAANAGVPRNKATPPKLAITLIRPVDRVPMVYFKKLEPDKITSFIMRPNDSRRIQLSMRVAYKPGFVEAVQKMVGQKVTPLIFTVSTLPNRQVEFDPAELRFEQRGRSWQPEVSKGALDILPLEENARFGGSVAGNEMLQGIVLLPAWMNPQEPIKLCYGDFCCLVIFADMN